MKNQTNHDFTLVDQIAGGKVKPDKKTKMLCSIRKMRHCNPACEIFEICPMMPVSLCKANVNSTCLLNAGGEVLLRRFVNLMLKGESGLLNEINNVIYSYGEDIETAPPSIKKEYAQMCMQLHKQLYADKDRATEMKPQLTVVINEMGRDGKEREVLIVPESLQVGRRDPRNPGGFKNELLVEAVEKAKYEKSGALDEVVDKESLFLSDKLDELKPEFARDGFKQRMKYKPRVKKEEPEEPRPCGLGPDPGWNEEEDAGS